MDWAVFLSLIISQPEILLLLGIASFILIFCWRKNGHVPGNWPVVGMLPSLILNRHRLQEWITEILRETGQVFIFKGPWFSQMTYLATCNPNDMHYTMKSNVSNFPKGTHFEEAFDVLGDGLITTSGESWRIQRRMAQKLMSGRKFRLFVEKVSKKKIERGLIPLLDHVAQLEMVVDLQDVLMRLTFDSISILVFGIDPGCLSIDFPSIPFAKATHEAEEVIAWRISTPRRLWKLQRWLNMGEERKMAKTRETIDHSLSCYISQRREEMKTPNKKETEEEETTDLLTSYLRYPLESDEKETGDQIKSDKFLRDTTLNLFAAGKDTSNSALTWFFWLLSKNPWVESKILDELRENSISDLDGLVYLQAALCETLRLFPSSPLVMRSVSKPDILPSGVKVGPGMTIIHSMYAMGRMEEIWGKDCLEFKPERWISDSGTLKAEHSRFMPFSLGPRTCMGRDMAFIQMKATAAAILKNFQIQVISGQHVNAVPSVVIYIKNGLKVKVRKRLID